MTTISFAEAIALITEDLVRIGENASNEFHKMKETVETVVSTVEEIARRLASEHGVPSRDAVDLVARIIENVRRQAWAELDAGTAPEEVIKAVQDNSDRIEASILPAILEAAAVAKKRAPLIERLLQQDGSR